MDSVAHSRKARFVLFAGLALISHYLYVQRASC